MDVPAAALVPFLETDLPTHLVTLKFLNLFPQGCACRFERDASGWASLVRFDASLFAWDRQVYPQVGAVVFLDGTSLALVDRMAAALGDEPVVLKTADPRAQDAVEARGKAPLRCFWWYGTERKAPGTVDGVREITGPDPVLDALLVGNGYTEEELAGFRAKGARGYLAQEDGQARAFCLVYPNFGPVWEVGSVKTVPGFERRGWASRVVRAAVGGILDRGQVVRYHVEGTNGPSRALALSLGLSPRVETRHYAFGWEATATLAGGGMNAPRLVGGRIRKPATEASATIHELLVHLRGRGLDWVPRSYGIEDGDHVLEFLPGTVPHDAPDWVWTPQVLTGAAAALRAFHDAAAGFSGSDPRWLLETGEPPEVVCHNDFAPYNVVFRDGRFAGLIDFDVCAPGSRLWDLAYAAYRFVPLMPFGGPVRSEALSPFRVPQMMERLDRFLEAYAGNDPGLRYGRREVLAKVVTRLGALARRPGDDADLYTAHAFWVAALT